MRAAKSLQSDLTCNSLGGASSRGKLARSSMRSCLPGAVAWICNGKSQQAVTLNISEQSNSVDQSLLEVALLRKIGGNSADYFLFSGTISKDS